MAAAYLERSVDNDRVYPKDKVTKGALCATLLATAFAIVSQPVLRNTRGSSCSNIPGGRAFPVQVSMAVAGLMRSLT